MTIETVCPTTHSGSEGALALFSEGFNPLEEVPDDVMLQTALEGCSTKKRSVAVVVGAATLACFLAGQAGRAPAPREVRHARVAPNSLVCQMRSRPCGLTAVVTFQGGRVQVGTSGSESSDQLGHPRWAGDSSSLPAAT